MRHEAVAGSFYQSSKADLERFINDALGKAAIDRPISKKAVSFVAPHAGYTYSGFVAAHTYAALSLSVKARSIDTFVVIGPNHTGYGTPISISAEDWRTPLGIVKNDRELSGTIASLSDYMSIDEEAHAAEHSIEVQLPFLQSVISNPKCAFICMGDQSMAASKLLADAIMESSQRLGRAVAIIASSDFNHYESEAMARKKDMPSIDALKSIDYGLFNRRLREAGDSACGYGPITVAAIFAKRNGASEGRLLKYATSGDVTGDNTSVVAYASIIFA